MYSRQVASMAASNVAAVQAGKQAEQWAELTDTGPEHAQATAPADAAAEVADDLQDLDLLLAEIQGCCKEKKAGGSSKALQPPLQQLRSVHCTALLKSSVLQGQLELLRRAVVYQSQSVTSLIQQTVQAVKRLVAQHSGSSSRRQSGSGQIDGGGTQDGLSQQQRRQQQEQCHTAAAAMGEVLAAKDTLQQAPGEGSLRALVACLVGAGDRLQHVPELLVAAADRLAGGTAVVQQQEAAGSGREQLIEVLETVQQVGSVAAPAASTVWPSPHTMISSSWSAAMHPAACMAAACTAGTACCSAEALPEGPCLLCRPRASAWGATP
jgi:hypothetical protein